jgi:very-short-patch-repair endonuclease
VRLIADLDGMAQKKQLVARGAHDHDLTNAVRRGDVIRVRNGWYTTLSSDDPRVHAVRVGGRLTGSSAVSALGGWVRSSTILHVSIPVNASRQRAPRNRRRRLDKTRHRVELHWDSREASDRGSSTIVALSEALCAMVLHEPFEDAIAALDWAMHTGRLDRFDFETLLLHLPEKLRFVADWVDPMCESLPESLARTRLRQRGHRVQTQVTLGDVQRIDLVVDEEVALEVDGEEFHLARFHFDREKDMDITAAGFHAIRPSARLVFEGWERVYRAITVALERRGVGSRENSGPASRFVTRTIVSTQIPSRRRSAIPEFPKGRGN